ncbi:hypothetical protein TNCV_860761 [Trichonephila clavipes]|nr:hypothetical protein TNCV_860761 [Trichonephila clavipes]
MRPDKKKVEYPWYRRYQYQARYRHPLLIGGNECLLTSDYKAAREFLETDLLLLNLGQMPRTTLELASFSQNYHTTTMGRTWILDRFKMHHLLYTTGLQLH